MTLYVDTPIQTIHVNLPNLDAGGWVFDLTSQYSHETQECPATLISTNDRYSTLTVQFPAGFEDEHKNGIYYYSLRDGDLEPITYGLVKIITQPGGDIGTTTFNAGAETEERVADVFYRPNY
jgi:hypothetical protein